MRGRIQYATDLPEDRRTLLELRKESDFYNLVVLKDLIDICLDKHESLVDEWKKNYIKKTGFESESVRDVRFRRCDVGNYFFENITFWHKVDFEYANLTEATFSKCSFHQEVSFKNAELVKAKFTDCKFKKGVLIYFDEANLDGCDFGKISNLCDQDLRYQGRGTRPGNNALDSLTSCIEKISFRNARNVAKTNFPEGKLEIIKRRYKDDFKPWF